MIASPDQTLRIIARVMGAKSFSCLKFLTLDFLTNFHKITKIKKMKFSLLFTTVLAAPSPPELGKYRECVSKLNESY